MRTDPEEYRKRFPEYAEIVDRVFVTAPVGSPTSGPLTTTQLRDIALDSDTDHGARPLLPDPSQADEFIGKYPILCEIGRGGHG